MNRLWLALGLPTLLLVVLATSGATKPACTPIPTEPECTAEECGDGLDNDCDGAVDEDCTPPGGACYADADCATGELCAITDDCCAPPGCLPGMECPAVCARCGECVPAESECRTDSDCAADEVCRELPWCPACTYAEPACMMPCRLIGVCGPRPACTNACDCYDAGLEFPTPCPMMCAMCDNYWTCEEGACVPQCGPVPVDIQACRR